MNHLKYESEKYAQEWSTNEIKREAFVAGAAWLGRYIVQLQDHGIAEVMASDSMKKYLDELAIKDIRKILDQLYSVKIEGEKG